MVARKRNTIDLLYNFLEEGDYNKVDNILHKMHCFEVSSFLQRLDAKVLNTWLNYKGFVIEPEVIKFLDEKYKEFIIPKLEMEGMAKLFRHKRLIDLSNYISFLSLEDQNIFLEYLDRDVQNKIKAILNCNKNSVAWLMHQDFWAFPEDMDVLEAIEKIKKHIFVCNDIYIFNDEFVPIGFTTVNRLLNAKEHKKLKDIGNHNFVSINIYRQKNEAAKLFLNYHLTSLPVVDFQGKLIGIITSDNILDSVRNLIEEEFLNIYMISDTEMDDPVLKSMMGRFRWLIVTLINSVIASCAIAQFQGTIQKHVALAVLMPIAGALAGNSGMQVVTIMVRSLSQHSPSLQNPGKVLLREIQISLLNGLAVGLFLGLFVYIWFQDFMVVAILVTAVVFNILWAAFAGTLLPLSIHFMGMDPALSAGPFLTTTTDVIGFGFFLGLAKIFLD